VWEHEKLARIFVSANGRNAREAGLSQSQGEEEKKTFLGYAFM
jgi:hypothetical protein